MTEGKPKDWINNDAKELAAFKDTDQQPSQECENQLRASIVNALNVLIDPYLFNISDDARLFVISLIAKVR